MFPELAALLFASRDFAHRAHLSSNSFAEHKILESFYENLLGLIDELVESYQGRHGVVTIPLCDPAPSPTVIDTIRAHLIIIETVRAQAVGVDTPLQSKVDEICLVYLRTIYQLSRLH